MKFIQYHDKEQNYDFILPICESCLTGKHVNYGYDHRIGESGRRDCKNVSDVGHYQCLCTQDEEGLYATIQKGIPPEKIFDTEEEAKADFDKNKKLEEIKGVK